MASGSGDASRASGVCEDTAQTESPPVSVVTGDTCRKVLSSGAVEGQRHAVEDSEDGTPSGEQTAGTAWSWFHQHVDSCLQLRTTTPTPTTISIDTVSMETLERK